MQTSIIHNNSIRHFIVKVSMRIFQLTKLFSFANLKENQKKKPQTQIDTELRN